MPAGGWAPPLRGGDLVVSCDQRRFQRGGMFDPHERAVARSKQKIRIYERSEQRRAGLPIQTPKTAGLGLGQPEAGHLKKFPLDAPEHFVIRLCRLWRHNPSFSLR